MPLKQEELAAPSLQNGVSHGGGQTEPMNFKNDGPNKEVIDELNSMSCFTRIASFASGIIPSFASVGIQTY